ncbi:MAG: hypothetical protein Q8S11_15020 [Daejeonella sp.]|uniref:hypothetical protein n=1 Tax=Daejeonella sp. TaxID=2805397 RepID=UPI0027341B89|nr:hypothetical protein [Daejeonella sp.]MDP3469650.1 hypothetical protein [Daejeonella sp.]
MEKIKPTSKADISKKTKALNGLIESLDVLATLKDIVATKLDVVFSEECTECGNQAKFIQTARKMFQEMAPNYIAIHLVEFNKSLEINERFPHYDDIETETKF